MLGDAAHGPGTLVGNSTGPVGLEAPSADVWPGTVPVPGHTGMMQRAQLTRR